MIGALTPRMLWFVAIVLALAGILAAVLMTAADGAASPTKSRAAPDDATPPSAPSPATRAKIEAHSFRDLEQPASAPTHPASRPAAARDSETSRFLAELEAADQATKGIDETYGTASPDEERFRALPLHAYLWQLLPEYHAEAIKTHLATEYIDRFGLRSREPGSDAEFDEAIRDLTKSWIIYARLRARLAWVEPQLARTSPGGERTRLQGLQTNLVTYTQNGLHHCNRIATRFAERFAMIEPYVTNRRKH